MDDIRSLCLGMMGMSWWHIAFYYALSKKLQIFAGHFHNHIHNENFRLSSPQYMLIPSLTANSAKIFRLGMNSHIHIECNSGEGLTMHIGSENCQDLEEEKN